MISSDLIFPDGQTAAAMSQDAIDPLSQIPSKRLLSPSSTSPRNKRASTNELDSSDEVSAGASHLHIVESPSPTTLNSSMTVAAPAADAAGPAEDEEERTNSFEKPPAYDAAEDGVDAIQREVDVVHADADEDDDDDEEEEEDAVPAPLDQVAQICLLRAKPLVKDDEWYLISRVWFQRWSTACSGQAESKDDDPELGVNAIGPISNLNVIDDEGKLKLSMQLGMDLMAVPKEAWFLLSQWYGVEGPVFARVVVGNSTYDSERIELYPPTFHPYKIMPSNSAQSHRLPESLSSLSLPSTSTLSHLKIRLQYILEAQQPLRLWRLPLDFIDNGLSCVFEDFIVRGGAEPIEIGNVTDSSTLSEALLDDQDNRLAVEEQGNDGSWLVVVVAESAQEDEIVQSASALASLSSGSIFGTNKFMANNPVSANTLTPRYASAGTQLARTIVKPLSSAYNSLTNGMGVNTRSKSQPRSIQGGLVGLQNLGNTCFMNSALQCMSNTKELQEYFTSGVYKSELNPDNPLGMNGQVAEAFGQLITRMWSSNNSGSVAPREFKQALSKFAPSFSGYGQQDTQELLAFLLDGIHEDLNRIKRKPGTNAPDWEGEGDKDMIEMARTCWEQYRSRNDSVIVDLFQGQYRSTVVCPDCDKISITFDPFMYVTMNLPVVKQWRGVVVFVPLDLAKPRVQIKLEHSRMGTIKTLKAAVGDMVKCDPKLIYLVEVYSSKPWKTWTDDEQVTDVKDGDYVYFFETTHHVPQIKTRSYGYGKTTPAAPTLDLPAAPASMVIPVVHSARIAKIKHTAFNRITDPELFGLPFLLSLTPLEASSIDSIYRILVARYASISPKGEEMLETLSPLEEEMVDALAAGNDVEAMDATAMDLTMDADDQVSPSPLASTSTLPIDSILDPSLLPPSPSSDVPTSTPGVVQQKPLFRIRVSQRAAATVPDYTSAYSVSIVDLDSRLSRSRSPDSDIFPTADSTPSSDSSISSTNGKGKSMMSDEGTTSSFNMDDAPMTFVDTPPPFNSLLSKGDYLITEWAKGALEYYFGTDGAAGWDDFEQLLDPQIVAAEKRKAEKKVISIDDCLREFTREERLGEDDTWYCPDCKKHQQATKKVEIWKVPDVLVFNLKRFSASRYSRDKLEDFVDFPIEEFNLEAYVEGDKVERRLAMANGDASSTEEPDSLIYDLYAVDNHYGGLGGGHYTAYAKNHETGKWYDFDDSRVSEIDADRVRTKAAYLLFYRRRTTRPIGARTRELVESAIQSRNASKANSEANFSPTRSRSPSPAHSSGSELNRRADSDGEGDFLRPSPALGSTLSFYNMQRQQSNSIRPSSRSHQSDEEGEANSQDDPSRVGSNDAPSDTEADRGDSAEDERYDAIRGNDYPLSAAHVSDGDDDVELGRRLHTYPLSVDAVDGDAMDADWLEDGKVTYYARAAEEDYDAVDNIRVDAPETSLDSEVYRRE